MKKWVYVDGEPFSRAHSARARNLIHGWIRILYWLFFENVDSIIIGCDKLNLVKERANELIDLHFRKMYGRLILAPDGLAAAALYIACVENNLRQVTQFLIASLAGRTDVWVRNNYKKLRKELGLHFDTSGSLHKPLYRRSYGGRSCKSNRREK